MDSRLFEKKLVYSPKNAFPIRNALQDQKNLLPIKTAFYDEVSSEISFLKPGFQTL